MAITVNVQENPVVSKVGKSIADSTIINSGYNLHHNELVTYHIRSMDTQFDIKLSSAMNILTCPQIISIHPNKLEIILPTRRQFKIRTKRPSNNWSHWTTFTTRDKTYVTPVAIYTSKAEFDYNPRKRGNKTVEVTNVGKSSVQINKYGRHPGCPVVYNTDNQYNGTTSITYTRRGATVIADNFYA